MSYVSTRADPRIRTNGKDLDATLGPVPIRRTCRVPVCLPVQAKWNNANEEK